MAVQRRRAALLEQYHFECQCAKGTFPSDDECKLCSVNTYNDEEGANTCKGVCLYMCMCAQIGEERVVVGGGYYTPRRGSDTTASVGKRF